MGLIFKLSTGRNMEYRRYGDIKGYPIIGFHGLIGTVDVEGLDQKISGLPIQYILIARPGYGKSDYYPMKNIMEWTADIREFLDAFRIRECDIIGMSAGAPYAYALASSEPNRVKSLYICSGFGAIYKPDVLAGYSQTETFLRELQLFQEGSLDDIVKYLNELFFKPLSKDEKKAQVIIDSFANGGLGMALCAKLEFQNWGFDIENVKQPVLIFHSREDEEVPYIVAEKTANYLKNVEIYAYKNQPHASPLMLEDIMKKIIISLGDL